MFLKRMRNPKSRKGKAYWALVKSVRTERGPRHEVVAYLGELSGSEQSGWAKVGREFGGRLETGDLFDEGRGAPVPEDVEVRVRDVRVERTRDFGDVYLGLRLWRALGLDELLKGLMERKREKVEWDVMACLLALARFCEPSSELHTAQSWYGKTALEDLLGVPEDRVNKDRLYRTLDRILPFKETIEKHLKERFSTLFDTRYDLLLYDVTSTYFEGEMEKNPQARRGYSRDKRPDCKQICIGLVVTREGLPVGYEVFAGNRTDVTTLEDMVDVMEERHGRMERIWVLDRGMVSEDNLAYLKERGGMYIVGTPKAKLKEFERQLLETSWTEVEPGVEVQLCEGPQGEETFILCRSAQRKEKEKGIHERFEGRIEEGLERLSRRLKRAKKLPDRVQVERQIGRLLQRNSRAAELFNIQTTEIEKDGKKGHLKVEWSKQEDWRAWSELSEGCYLLRTNLKGWGAEDLWHSYIQLTQAEAAFRIQKSDLKIRPIWHQLEHRAQAHVLFSYLAYAMWKTLEQWMQRAGLGNAPRTVIDELARIKAQDVILPTSAGREIRLACVTVPDGHQRVLLQRLGLHLPARLGEPKWRHKNVQCSHTLLS